MRLHELQEMIDLEEVKLHQALAEINITLKAIESGTVESSITRNSAASIVAQTYSGIENILKLMAKFLGRTLPVGADWHIELIKIFQQRPDNPEGFIAPTLYSGLSVMRKFRHVVHHGYAFDLEFEQVRIALEGTPDLIHAFLVAAKNRLAQSPPD